MLKNWLGKLHKLSIDLHLYANSLIPIGYGVDYKCVIFKMVTFTSISNAIVFRWMVLCPTDETTLVQAMAEYCQFLATLSLLVHVLHGHITGPGARFTNDFLPAIQIWWKLRLAVIPLLAIRSQQIVAHATTAQLSWHVQNFVAITVLELRWEWNEISMEFELRWINRLFIGKIYKYQTTTKHEQSSPFIWCTECTAEIYLKLQISIKLKDGI